MWLRMQKIGRFPVHPHLRGDNRVKDVERLPQDGSPHLGGDNPPSKSSGSYSIGSPPLAWGQLLQGLEQGFTNRFTPTCVGIIVVPSNSTPRRPVHPHLRGDNLFHDTGFVPLAGSPPLAWGQLEELLHPALSHRFTPTNVGIILRVRFPQRLNPVHPHIRGDNTICTGGIYHDGGSPPLAWGQWRREIDHREESRFTPTCVGTIPGNTPGKYPNSVHPHLRGDNLTHENTYVTNTGSPPLGWGKPIETTCPFKQIFVIVLLYSFLR